MNPLLKIENASAFIPGDASRRLVLQNVNLEIHRGRHYLVSGENGSGKSSLLKLMAGDLAPCSGKVFWYQDGKYDDSRLAGKSLVKIVSPEIQENCQRQNWDITGWAMLLGAGANTPFSNADIPRAREMRIWEILSALNALDLLELSLPAMSQGQLRLVLLAGAILAEPEILLLDECLDGLDAKRTQKFISLLETLKERMTVVFTSHRPDALPGWPLERWQMIHGTLSADTPCLEQEPNLADDILPRRRRCASGSVVFELKNVSTYVERELVLKNINWIVRRGEHWRVSGANGSGKSTLLRLLAGDEFAASGGSLAFRFGRRGKTATTLEEKRNAISLVSDLGQALYGYNLTGLEFLLTGLDNAIGVYREFNQEEIARASHVLKVFFPEDELEEMIHASIRRLSSGQMRRLFLGRALMNRPSVLLLDEPCTGLDAASRTSFLALLDRLAFGGISSYKPQLIFVSHHEEDAPACINRHAMLKDGNLIILK